MMKNIILILLVTVSFNLISQDTSTRSSLSNLSDNSIFGNSILFFAPNVGFQVNPINDRELGSINFQGVLGMQITERFSFGIGSGMEKADIGLIPIFADIRFNFKKSDHTPFLHVKQGYSVAFGNDDENESYSGGQYSFGGIGFKSRISSAASIEFSIGYKYFVSKSSRWGWNWPNGDLTNTYNRAEVRFGIIFN